MRLRTKDATAREFDEFAGVKLLFTSMARQSLGVFGLTDVALRIKLDAELLHQMKLRFEEVDVILLVLHQLLEQVAGHVVARAMAMGRRLLVKRARRNLGLEIAIEN